MVYTWHYNLNHSMDSIKIINPRTYLIWSMCLDICFNSFEPYMSTLMQKMGMTFSDDSVDIVFIECRSGSLPPYWYQQF